MFRKKILRVSIHLNKFLCEFANFFNSICKEEIKNRIFILTSDISSKHGNSYLPKVLLKF